MKLKNLAYRLFLEPYEELEKRVIEKLENDAYSYFDMEEKIANKKLVKGVYIITTAAGAIGTGYSFLTGAPSISYVLWALCSSVGLSLYKHYDCIKKRALIVKDILSSYSEKKKPMLEEIENYSKVGRKTHLVGAASLMAASLITMFLINPTLTLLFSPLAAIWLRHVYKGYKIVYYMPIKWLKEKFKQNP